MTANNRHVRLKPSVAKRRIETAVSAMVYRRHKLAGNRYTFKVMMRELRRLYIADGKARAIGMPYRVFRPAKGNYRTPYGFFRTYRAAW